LNKKEENKFLPEGISLYKRLYRSKEYIDDCYNEPIDLNLIASKAYFSPYHFLRLFKKVYNKTPHQYLTERRIEKAKELLSKSDMPITHVCFEIGFESVGSFSTLFNKRVGFSPAEYRLNSSRKIFLSVNFPEKLIPLCFFFTFKS